MPVPLLDPETFERTSQLSRYQMPKAIPLMEVIRVLNAAKIRYVLVGAYGLAGWRHEARTTEDVDVVVAARQIKKAVTSLLEAFPDLEAVDLPMVVRLRVKDTTYVAVDVMKPAQQPYIEVFKHTKTVKSNGETYRVPSLEMAIVMKFSAIASPYRAPEDKHRDAHDFIRMVKYNPDLDKRKLGELADLIYPEGHKDILEMVRRVEAGEMLIL